MTDIGEGRIDFNIIIYQPHSTSTGLKMHPNAGDILILIGSLVHNRTRSGLERHISVERLDQLNPEIPVGLRQINAIKCEGVHFTVGWSGRIDFEVIALRPNSSVCF